MELISQALIIQDNKVLMVKQYVQRGDIVWNFPGGGVEANETPEQACIRETKEETGFDIKIEGLLYTNINKHSFRAQIMGGEMYLDYTEKNTMPKNLPIPCKCAIGTVFSA